ncbi:hypothetical protein [Streptomyces cellostaticus]|uniref:hypothetical protein n=1 Tax=Streptomyces cellostaticus TaxID=67285 RepID=UPI0020266CF5|nr:hypothetical protein [Streptomyces cellostaticus]
MRPAMNARVLGTPLPRPAKSPRQIPVGTTAWAHRMVQARAETIRLLKDTENPVR